MVPDTKTASPQAAVNDISHRFGDPLVLTLTMGFIVLFLGWSIYDTAGLTTLIADGFAWTAKYLGSFFQALLLATFFIAISVAMTRAGQAKVGNLDKPEISTFRWLSMIMCTLLAGGGVFFAAGEPVYHFVVTPPAFDTEAGTAAAVAPALSQAFMHWGFLAWAVLGSLTAILLAYAHYDVFLALAIGAVIFIFGPTLFLTNVYLQSMGEYLSSFMAMATMTSETAPDWWMQWWTVFFFAWFIGYTPLMAIFVARISRGRTIREMILAVAVLAPIATTIWFTLLGGSGCG